MCFSLIYTVLASLDESMDDSAASDDDRVESSGSGENNAYREDDSEYDIGLSKL